MKRDFIFLSPTMKSVIKCGKVKITIAKLLLDIAEALKELCTLYFLTVME
jgi:hypothetical protein